MSNSHYDFERDNDAYDSDDCGEIHDDNTGDYIKIKTITWLNKLLGLIEDDVPLHISAISSEISLLETSNASIDSENSEAPTHTLSGLLQLLLAILDNKHAHSFYTSLNATYRWNK